MTSYEPSLVPEVSPMRFCPADSATEWRREVRSIQSYTCDPLEARVMQIRLRLGCIAGLALILASGAYAQNLTITNARILDGTGRVIERGAVVVRDGKIASVSATAPAAGTGRTINANGKTVMPGLIDAHRHIVTGNPADWLTQRAPQQLQEFLDAGFTPVLCSLEP